MLKQLIEDVKSWTELNSIPIFEGEIPDTFPTTKWEQKETNESLIHFLNLAKKIIPKFRTPYLSQSKLTEISKTILNSVPGNVVSVWFNRLASSAAA